MAFKKATVNATRVASTQTDFPAYVDLSRLGITTLAQAQSVRVYADSGKTTEWAREIVSATEMWVKIPSLTTTTDIYVDYDGIRADYAVTDTYGRNSVWLNYWAVFHNQESSGTRENSVGGNNATQTGTVNSGSGKIQNGAEFTNNAANYLSMAYTSDLLWNGNSNKTLQFWVKSDLTSGVHSMVGRWEGIGQDYLVYQNGTGFVLAGRQSGAIITAVGNSSGVWYKIDVPMTASSLISLYRNASFIGSGTPTGAATGTNNLNVGMNVSGTPNNPFDGVIDEIRIAKDALSANWITTEYNNQNDEADFWGTWTDVSVAGAAASNLLMMGV